MRKGKDPDPDLLLTDLDADPGCPITTQLTGVRTTFVVMKSNHSDLLFGAPGTMDFPVTVVTLRAAVPAC
jgi:hypothetical protein